MSSQRETMGRMRNRTALVLGLAMLLLMATGLALAQEGPSDQTGPDDGSPAFGEDGFPPGNREVMPEGEDAGPPWLRYPDWSPPGPPPWAGQEEGEIPPPLQFRDQWSPGTPGPPPWAGQEDGEVPPPLQFRDQWSPGDGRPPWAGPDDEEQLVP